MTEVNVNKSNADYWRSDNPLIAAWWRFGDESRESLPLKVLDDNGDRDYASGLLVDSSMRRNHLLLRGDPDLFIRPTSGIAPGGQSVSGIILGEQPSTTWIEGSHGDTLFVDPEMFRESRTGGSQGLFGFGQQTLFSGLTVMGWVRIPDTATNPTTVRQIIGNYEQGSASFGGGAQWRLSWFPTLGSENRVIRAAYRANANFTVPAATDDVFVDSAGDNFPTIPGEEFFVAMQIHKELQPVLRTSAGSGLISIYVGTTVSGLRRIAQERFTSTDLRQHQGSDTTNFYSIAQDSLPSRGTSSRNEHLPPLTELDEWVIINDGYMTLDRMAHYMNSGLNHVVEDDPLRTEFIPVAPDDFDLVAQWTFDDQTGTNSAPLTSGEKLNVRLKGTVTAVPGVRGGSGIRVGNAQTRTTDISLSKSFPHITAGSGLNEIFPDPNVSDGWTFIGWIRDRSDSGSRFGGNVGWYAGANDHMAMSWGDWRNSTTGAGDNDFVGYGMNWTGSGTPGFTTNSGPVSPTHDTGGFRVATVPDHWQLWAWVIDFRNGIQYRVRDAKHTVLETMRFHGVSGLSKEELKSHTIGGQDGNTDAAAFGFTAVNAGSSNRYPEFDDWAVFNKVLTLPEMSGYALSGVVAPVSNFATSFKQTLGYWVFDDVNREDYTTGSRYNDQGWYRHHLTNISGSLTPSGSIINRRINNNSLQVETSGAMLSVERIFLGSNLDFSDARVLGSSGFTAGCWAYMPSGDTGLGGDGLDGDGTHHLLGHWSQALTEQAWQLGIQNNKFFISVQGDGNSLETLESDPDVVPYNQDFFVATSVTPSGSNYTVELWLSTDFEDPTILQQVGRSTSFASFDRMVTGSSSGFSILNVPNRQQGFPSGTRIQTPFVYAGGMDAGQVAEVGRLGINNIVLESGLVDPTDTSNLDHWRLNEQGRKVSDFGRAENILNIINQDGNDIGTFSAIHNDGTIIRRSEYLSDLNAPGTSGDLGRDLESFTVLGWVKFNEVFDSVDRHVLFTEGGAESGTQMYTEVGLAQPLMIASGALTASQNGDLPPAEWAHVAFIYDRDNNEFTSVVNARYAGTKHDEVLPEVPVSDSGIALGGRGSPTSDAIIGGAGFSGILDDWMTFRRALTLPEISGLAANTASFNFGQTTVSGSPVGAYVSGLILDNISGFFGAFLHGADIASGVVGGYMSGIEGVFGPHGGFIHGKAFASGVFGGFVHGADIVSGVFGTFVHGIDTVSGVHGSYIFGSCQDSGEFDITFLFQVVDTEDFDARLGVELTRLRDFDAQLKVAQITLPPVCSIEIPLPETILERDLPTLIAVRGSGRSLSGKTIEQVRFTFADFRGAESGVLISGIPDDGIFEATHPLHTQGLYTIKIEVVDSFGYRGTCCQQLLLIPTGGVSGEILNSFPGIFLETNPTPSSGDAKFLVDFTHSISGIDTISGVYEYTDYADQQESQITSLEMPSGSIAGKVYTVDVRQHEYSVPGTYCPVWAASGDWGIVSDTVADGFDALNF
jgi:hypothetical protein